MFTFILAAASKIRDLGVEDLQALRLTSGARGVLQRGSARGRAVDGVVGLGRIDCGQARGVGGDVGARLVAEREPIIESQSEDADHHHCCEREDDGDAGALVAREGGEVAGVTGHDHRVPLQVAARALFELVSTIGTLRGDM